MSELPKKYDSHDDSRNNKVSSSKACNSNIKDTERQRKHPRSDEGCSRHILLNHQQTNDINQNQHGIPKPKEKDATALVPIRYIPDLKNKHQRHQFDAIKVGMKFTGVIDGSFPGGYLITVGVGNLPTLSGVAMLNSDQPARIEGDFNENVPLIPTKIGLTRENQNERTNSLRNAGNLDPCNDINMDKILPVVKVEDEFIPEYSDSEMLCSNEVRIPYEPVVLKPVNPLIGMPIHQTNSVVDKGKCISNEYYSAPTGCGTMIDPFLQRNFSSSALTITPPSDQVATSSFPGITPTAETRNFLQHHQESQNQVGNKFPALNLKDIMRVPGPGSSSAQAQQSDHTQPNSSSPTSKRSKHMQDNN
ncbi:hypothetical protein P8452_19791 [Trifolium repens]|nr:hypothetical protein P8452_19791 [Trifolium repens]